MSAEELRKAAETLRQRVGTTMPGPWWRDGITVRGGPEGRSVASATNAVRANAEYVATMHPGVGLALADWLDAEFAHEFGPTEHAITIARLINGGAS